MLEPAAKETYLKWAIALSTTVGAGFSLTGCTPSPDNGFCMEAGFNLAELEVKPGYSQTFRWLYKEGASEPFARSGIMTFDIPWELKIFSGEVKVYFQVLWFTIEWIIKEFAGITIGEGKLFELSLPLKEFYR